MFRCYILHSHNRWINLELIVKQIILCDVPILVYTKQNVQTTKKKLLNRTKNCMTMQK